MYMIYHIGNNHKLSCLPRGFSGFLIEKILLIEKMKIVLILKSCFCVKFGILIFSSDVKIN